MKRKTVFLPCDGGVLHVKPVLSAPGGSSLLFLLNTSNVARLIGYRSSGLFACIIFSFLLRCCFEGSGIYTKQNRSAHTRNHTHMHTPVSPPGHFV